MKRDRKTLEFWHCDYCHKGLIAGEIHDITDHKVRCFGCAAVRVDLPLPEYRCPECNRPSPYENALCDECYIAAKFGEL
jgi:hypothetical protein